MNMDMEYDVVVIGSGAAGMTAAIVAADQGLSVCVLEKSDVFGGTSAYSGGGMNIPNNHLAAENGIDDSADIAREYYRNVLGNFYDSSKIDAFIDTSPKLLRYIEEHTEVKFKFLSTTDYEPWHEGARDGRQLFVDQFDGRRLGRALKDLRRPWPQLGLFGDMQIRTWEVPTFLSMFKSRKAFRTATGLFARHAMDKVCYGRGMRLCMGNALMGGLMKAALDRKIPLRNRCAVRSIVMDEDRAAGVVVTRDGHEEAVLARHGIILAAGGFGGDEALRKRFFPEGQGATLAADTTTGDGIRMGEAAGGAFVTENIHNGIWVPMSSMTAKDGSQIRFPHLVLDRHCTRTLIVDGTGHRFVNEGCNYQIFCDVMQRNHIGEAFIIANHDFVRAKGLGLVKPAPMSMKPYLRAGYLFKGRTIEALAREIGVPPDALEQTIKTFDTYAEAGVDADFHRGEDQYSARKGDGVGTNPSLGPIGEGPYYAIRIQPGNLGSVCGLETNASAQVLSAQGLPIEGLYAAGTNANSVFRGGYPTGGSSLGPAMTFAYIAARHIAAVRPGAL